MSFVIGKPSPGRGTGKRASEFCCEAPAGGGKLGGLLLSLSLGNTHKAIHLKTKSLMPADPNAFEY